MLKYRQVTNDQTVYKVENNFYHYYKKQKINTDKKQNKTISDIVSILEDQKIVAVFQGAPELVQEHWETDLYYLIQEILMAKIL